LEEWAQLAGYDAHMSALDKMHLCTVFFMVLLVFVVTIVLGARRFSAIQRGIFPKDYFKVLRSEKPFVVPPNIEQASRNLINLFEMPVIFYLLVLLLIWTQKTDYVTLTLCSIFVASRYAHSLVHLTSNRVKLRFLAYSVGFFALLVAWVRFAWMFKG
jgi:hypothetical protein